MTGLRVSGVGSSHRSRKTVSTSPTAGPRDRQLDVVPRRPGPVDRRHRLRLRVAPVIARRRGGCGTGRSRRRTRRRARVGRGGAARRTSGGATRPGRTRMSSRHCPPAASIVRAETRVLLAPRTAAPRAASARPGRGRPRRGGPRGPGPRRRRCPPRAEPLVGVHPPPGEQHQVAGAQPLQGDQQLGEVVGAMDERPHPVAARPGQTVRVPRVQPGPGVAPLGRVEEPVGRGHNRMPTRSEAARASPGRSP